MRLFEFCVLGLSELACFSAQTLRRPLFGLLFALLRLDGYFPAGAHVTIPSILGHLPRLLG